MSYLIYIIKNYLSPIFYFLFKIAISVFAVYLIFQTKVDLNYERIILVFILILPWNIIKSIKIAGNEISTNEGNVEKNQVKSGIEGKEEIIKYFKSDE
jgi:uncharacterized membrane protein